MYPFLIKNINIVLLFLLFILIFIIRIFGLTRLNLWRDEAFSVILSSKNIIDVIKLASQDTSGTLYQVILSLWISIFGNSVFSVRFLSVIFSLGTSFYLLLLTRKYYQFRDVFIINLLFGINVIAIFYAQEARTYSLLSFLTLASIYHLNQTIVTKKLFHRFFYILVTSLLIYTHNTAIITVCAEIGFIVIYYIRSGKVLIKADLFRLKRIFIKMKQFFRNKSALKTSINWILTYLSIFILVIPQVTAFIIQQGKVKEEGFWLTFEPIKNLTAVLTGFATGIRLFTNQPFDMFDAVMNITILALFVLGFVRIIQTKKEFLSKWPIYYFAVIIILMFLISIKQPMFYIRYASHLTPLFIIIIWEGLLLTRDYFKKFPKIYIILLVLILSFNAKVFYMYQTSKDSKSDSVSLINTLKNDMRENDLILHDSARTFFPIQFYSNLDTYIFDPDGRTQFYLGRILLQDKNFLKDQNILYNYDRIWVIYLDEIFSEELMPLRNYKVVKTYKYDGYINLNLLVRNEKTCDCDTNL